MNALNCTVLSHFVSQTTVKLMFCPGHHVLLSSEKNGEGEVSMLVS